MRCSETITTSLNHARGACPARRRPQTHPQNQPMRRNDMSYLTHFTLREVPFDKDIPDADLWLPPS